MTQPITNTTPVKTNAYVQVEGGKNNYVNDQELSLGATLGGQIQKGGTYANAEVGYGTTFKAKAEVGHEFNIGNNMGLELSGNAEYKKSTMPTVLHSSLTVGRNSIEGVDKWHNGLKKAGISLMMTFQGKKGNVKVGAEVGTYSNSAPNISKNYTINDDTTQIVDGNETIIRESHTADISYNGKKSGENYVTPKISAELNLDKKGHWSAVANANLFGGNAGIKYTF